MRRQYSVLLLISFFFACADTPKTDVNYKTITQPDIQATLYQALQRLTDTIPTHLQKDSLYFLILPVEAACPSCRKKTIDSLAIYQDKLAPGHFVIITGTAFPKIKHEFDKLDQSMPTAQGNIFIDSTNQAFIDSLVFNKPTIYIAYQKKVLKKITCVPLNVKKELHYFFSTSSSSI